MNMHRVLLKMVLGFEWDDGNKSKNLKKHGITFEEAEQIFTNDSLKLFPDEKHSTLEHRYGASESVTIYLLRVFLRDFGDVLGEKRSS